MNPFTRSLLQDIEDAALVAWVERWDELESLVVDIYRSKHAGADEERHYRRLRRELARAYPPWKEAIDPYWRGLRAGGRDVHRDPFQALLAPERAQDFLENWQAMQLLPAAREALNSYLLDRIEEG